MEEAEILVVDRELPDQMFMVRRWASEVEGAGFARWLAQPDLGRFLVLVPGASIGERLINAMDEYELGVIIAQQFMDLYKRARAQGDVSRSFRINAGVTPETRANIDRLMEQLHEIEISGGRRN